MRDYTNIFKDGVLVDVDVRYWSASKALQPEDLGLSKEEVAEAYKLGNKMLIPAEVIKAFRKIEGRARRVVEINSFPFPIGNARFIPKKKFPAVHKKLCGYRDEYTELVGDLISKYDQYRKEMLPIYRDAAVKAFINQSPSTHTFGPDYDREAEQDSFVQNFLARIESFYPPAESLRTRFSLDWNVFEIAIPRMKQKEAETVSEKETQRQIAEDEYHKLIQEKLSTFIDDVVQTLRNETVEICGRVVENIKEGKVIRSTTIDSLKRFVDRFSSLNFVGDNGIEAQLENLRQELLDSHSHSDFNDDIDLKEELGRRLGELRKMAVNSVDINSVTGTYRRRVAWRDEIPQAEAA